MSKDIAIISRLVDTKKGVVVGYQKQIYGDIGHVEDLWMISGALRNDIVLPAHEILFGAGACYIEHDRVDRLAFMSPYSHVGREPKENIDIFENDIVYWVDTDGRPFTKTITWNIEGGCWNVGELPYHQLKESGYYQTQMKVIGIEGITPPSQ
jgi:hypothetical protein